MEVITHHVGILSRNAGRSAVQYAAYCSRDKLYNAFNGLSYDYTHKNDLVHHEILLPTCAPISFYDQATLWNEVEQKEKNRNSRLARSVYFTIPNDDEIDRNAHINMARDYVERYFVKQGMCADVSIHDKGDGNPHAHVLLTTRSLDENGEWMIKQRKNYLLNADGTRMRDPVTNRYVFGKNIKTNNWDDNGNVEKWRIGWAETCNNEFERLGLKRRVTHLSYARQGIDREPTKHLGARVKALEDRGIITDRGNENRQIRARNEQKDRRLQRHQDREQAYERSR